MGKMSRTTVFFIVVSFFLWSDQDELFALDDGTDWSGCSGCGSCGVCFDGHSARFVFTSLTSSGGIGICWPGG